MTEISELNIPEILQYFNIIPDRQVINLICDKINRSITEHNEMMNEFYNLDRKISNL